MACRRVDIASNAMDIADNGVGAVITDTSKISAASATAGELASKYQRLAEALAMLSSVAAGASEAFKEFASEQEKVVEEAKDDKKLGGFWFMELYEKGYKDNLEQYKKEIHNLIEEEQKSAEKRIDIERELVSAVEGYNVIHSAAINARQSVFTKAYDAMGAEMRRFVETGKFSARAFGDAVAEQVKTELIGLAARASVWAIYETAMGLKDLATPGMQALAALHFKSALKFGAVAGASLFGAARIQESFFGGTDNQPSGGGGGGAAASLGGGPLPAGLDAGSPQATQNITVHIYNPLSEQNWQKIVEDNIIPAINGASEKNISVVVKTV